ncbi:MAG TPA: flagellar basal body P-ring formation chaperone FlgA [Steroidobacteraceae bacterium]|jgi:flagella basal body P-ring formation protein FlgA|nr:flagellar basal body P-ring formation chaperone FlgA [Steroidobacteraceae bacterium]
MPVNSLTLSFVLVTLMCGFAAPVRAQTAPADASIQSLAAVRRAAEAGLRRELDPSLTGVQLTAAELDSRMRLPACGAPLVSSATLPRGAQTRVLVRVACKTTANWTLNVPVDMARTTDVLVMRRAVARGESIGAGDVTVQSRVLPGLASPYVASVADLNGRLTRRPIPEGTALPADALQAALLIHRGQSVTLASSSAGVEVRAPGLAMADAAANQRVRVQNLNSLKIVEGVADTDGVVRVSP